jgi:protein Tex
MDTRAADPASLAEGYVSDAVPSVKDALAGARDILAEELSENAGLLGRLRDFMHRDAVISARVVPGKEEAGIKFSDYFDHQEKWATIPAHRALAILRASNEEIVTLEIAPDPETGADRAASIVAAEIGTAGAGPGDAWLREAAGWTWRVKLSLTMYLDLLSDLRRRAHEEAIAVFARNLKDLLLAAPAGSRPTLGLDPGIRTGVKAAVVDATGKLLETATLYPFQPRNDLRGAEAKVIELIRRHGVELVAIGNGTASRETERFVADALKLLPPGVARPTKVIVSEAGASVYSASETGGAGVSRPRRVAARRRVHRAAPAGPAGGAGQDRAAKAIGVGQYQHDVDQTRAGAGAGRGGRGRGERGRRRSEHRIRAAAGARVRGWGRVWPRQLSAPRHQRPLCRAAAIC